MRGGELIREARRRAGLSQTELAALLNTSQSTIVRWERGERSPSFETVAGAAEVCGLRLQVSLAAPDQGPLGVAMSMAGLTPEEKLRANRNLVRLKGLARERADV